VEEEPVAVDVAATPRDRPSARAAHSPNSTAADSRSNAVATRCRTTGALAVTCSRIRRVVKSTVRRAH